MNKRWRAADSRLASAGGTVDRAIGWRLNRLVTEQTSRPTYVNLAHLYSIFYSASPLRPRRTHHNINPLHGTTTPAAITGTTNTCSSDHLQQGSTTFLQMPLPHPTGKLHSFNLVLTYTVSHYNLIFNLFLTHCDTGIPCAHQHCNFMFYVLRRPGDDFFKFETCSLV
jgi:hypothetical protein